MKSRKAILVVDDDEVDVMTVKRALKELKITNPVKRAHNGEEALALLRSMGEHLPGLILLDINMPKMNGIEFLAELKKDSDLCHIPTIMLTTSVEQNDKVASFRLSVAGYMTKPVDYARFLDVMRTINMYWTMSEVPG